MPKRCNDGVAAFICSGWRHEMGDQPGGVVINPVHVRAPCGAPERRAQKPPPSRRLLSSGQRVTEGGLGRPTPAARFMDAPERRGHTYPLSPSRRARPRACTLTFASADRSGRHAADLEVQRNRRRALQAVAKIAGLPQSLLTLLAGQAPGAAWRRQAEEHRSTSRRHTAFMSRSLADA